MQPEIILSRPANPGFPPPEPPVRTSRSHRHSIAVPLKPNSPAFRECFSDRLLERYNIIRLRCAPTSSLHQRKNCAPTHPGPLGPIDHALADLSLIGPKSRLNIEDGVNVLERRIKACPIAQIANRSALFPYDVASLRVRSQAANLHSTLCERWCDRTGECARPAYAGDRRSPFGLFSHKYDSRLQQTRVLQDVRVPAFGP